MASWLRVHSASTLLAPRSWRLAYLQHSPDLLGDSHALAHPVVTLEPFNLHMSVEFIAIVVLGGVGTTFGAVSGAIAFLLLHPLASQLGLLTVSEAFSRASSSSRFLSGPLSLSRD